MGLPGDNGVAMSALEAILAAAYARSGLARLVPAVAYTVRLALAVHDLLQG